MLNSERTRKLLVMSSCPEKNAERFSCGLKPEVSLLEEKSPFIPASPLKDAAKKI